MSVDDPREIPRKRERLIHPVGLLVLAGVITLILYVMFPRETVFTTSDALDRPDALSIAYLRVLLRSDPDNSEVRLHLIRLTGQYREALALMGPLLDDPKLGTSPDVFGEYINLLAQDMFSRTQPDESVQAQHRLELALKRLTRMPWPEDRIRATLERRNGTPDPGIRRSRPGRSRVRVEVCATIGDRSGEALPRVRRARLPVPRAVPLRLDHATLVCVEAI